MGFGQRVGGQQFGGEAEFGEVMAARMVRRGLGRYPGPPRQVEPHTVEELQDSIRRVSGTDVTAAVMPFGTRWIDTARR